MNAPPIIPVAGGAGGAGGEAPGGPSAESWVVDLCSPTVTLENTDDSEAGAFVEDLLGDPEEFLHVATRNACRVAYRGAAEVPTVEAFHIRLEAFDGPGTIAGSTIRFGTTYLKNIEDNNGDAYGEALGVTHWLISHAYLHTPADVPGWVKSGSADFVRLSSGYLNPDGHRSGGNWVDGFQTTAYFFDWLVERDREFFYVLNQRFAPGGDPYEDAVFEDLTGHDLQSLWDEYQTSLP